MNKQHGAGISSVMANIGIPMGLIIAREYYPKITSKMRLRY